MATAEARKLESEHPEEPKYDYELHYYGVAGRGEFVRLMFEEVGASYVEMDDAKAVFEFATKNHVPGFPAHHVREGFPSFAPPLIKTGAHFESAQGVAGCVCGEVYACARVGVCVCVFVCPIQVKVVCVHVHMWVSLGGEGL